MSDPLVSVVIPCYNAARYVGATVESVLGQSFRDLEILAIDDGSTDATPTILRDYGTSVKYICQPNAGVSVARNTGISHARGKYVAFLDADDLWEETKLARQVRLLEDCPSVGLCFTGIQRVAPSLRPVSPPTAARGYPDYCSALLLYSCVVTGSCSSAMVRREFLEQTGGFDPAFSTCADWEHWLRLSRLTQFAPIDDPLVKYRVSPGSMSSDPTLVERDTFAVLDKFFSSALPARYAGLKRYSYSNHWLILSGCYLHAGKPGDSLRCLSRGLLLCPTNVRRPLGLPGRWLKRRLSWITEPS